MSVRSWSEHLMFLLLAVLVAGCATPPRRLGATDAAGLKDELRRPQSQDAIADILRPRDLSSVGEAAIIIGTSPQPIIGLGLVTGLGENGSDKGAVNRDVLDEVRKGLMREEGRTLEESREMLLSRDSSIVEVTGSILPGASPGDPFDVYLRSVDSAISLENGYLHVTVMAAYVTSGQETIRGESVGEAHGAVAPPSSADGVVEAAGGSRNGVLFDGGRFKGNRGLFVRFKATPKDGRRAVLTEYLINKRFSRVGVTPGSAPSTCATAINDRVVYVDIPPVYRQLPQRFADVVGALRGEYFYGSPKAGDLRALSQKLEEGSPQEKYRASVALEAVGDAAVAYLEQASGGDDWTALYSGQALAYLNNELGRTRVIAAADSPTEEIRLEAVRFLSHLTGRSVIDVLRAKVFDPSSRISIEAVEGLVAQGDGYAKKHRLAGFDLVAVRSVATGLIVKSFDRPMIVVAGIGQPLVGDVRVAVGGVGIGSVDETHVGIVSGLGARPETNTVTATVDNLLAALAGLDMRYATMKGIVRALEDEGNLPYEVTWFD